MRDLNAFCTGMNLMGLVLSAIDGGWTNAMIYAFGLTWSVHGWFMARKVRP